MATVTGIKFDDGLPVYSANCFPVRSLIRTDVEAEADGAWLVAHRAEQRRRFKAILCTKPKTYARIKEERRRAEKQGTTITDQNVEEDEEEEEKDTPALDGFFLMRHCCVEDPSDLCSVNISGLEMTDVKEEDLALFDNVAYVSAGENFLPFEAFRGFPILRELEMPLNGLRSIKPKIGDYPNLEVLDLSYNNLSHQDLLTLGLMTNLKVLHLTGNGLKTLPQNLAMPHFDDKSKTENMRFSKLEILLLDDNNLEDVSVFAALAGLSRLKHLNLEKNELYYVPMLKSVEGKVIPNDNEKDARKLRKSAERTGRKSARGTKSKDNTPRPVIERKEREETTEAPKPTPIPPNDVMAEVVGEKILENKPKEAEPPTQPDLLNEDLGDLSRQISDLDLEKEISIDVEGTEGKDSSGSTSQEKDGGRSQLGDGSGLPPFPDLRVLNLAYNKIEDEEALLAVAAWPMLMELIIHNNPLTTENSGDPPLLSRFLGERLGIRIRRMKESDVVKPPIEVKPKKSRHVTTVVPKIPKMNVDDLLMLEAPKPPSQPKPERTRSNMEKSGPLPPIPSSPADHRQRSRSNMEKKQRPRSPEEAEDEEQRETQKNDGDAFFMTQVDGQEEEAIPKEKSKKPKKKKQKQKENIASDKYKGYELLLDAEDDPNYCPPSDMHGNIKALKYALGHELVYRDPQARLDRISKPVEPYRKAEQNFGPPRVTQKEKKDQMLDNMKARVTTDEAGLDDVLYKNSKDLQKRFPDANRLLSEIQRRYNAVRVNSMKEAKDARKMLAGTLQEVPKKEGSKHVKLEA